MKTVLSKIYSRETTLFYFGTWDKSDRDGSERYIGESLPHNLRIAPPRGHNGEIWFSREQLHALMEKALTQINGSQDLQDQMVRETTEAWSKIEPYLTLKRSITDVDELVTYFHDLSDFWRAMSTPIFQLFEDERLDASFKKRMFEIRSATQEYTQRMSELFVEFFETNFPALHHLTYHVTWQDVVAISQGTADIAMLDKRAKEGCILFNGAVYMLSELDELLQQNDLVLEKAGSDAVAEVRGAIGYRGTISGVAKIVGNRGELEKVLAGDVLISSATDPDYVPAMQRAAAFVTDEGGIMSHAAIVAREMKKPCVIGTKFATQIFKDGDMVEVDAEKGVVRRL